MSACKPDSAHRDPNIALHCRTFKEMNNTLWKKSVFVLIIANTYMVTIGFQTQG